jgi:hypothetical protein
MGNARSMTVLIIACASTDAFAPRLRMVPGVASRRMIGDSMSSADERKNEITVLSTHC